MSRAGLLLLVLAACTTAGRSDVALLLQVRGVDESQGVTFDATNVSSDAVLITEAVGYDFYFVPEIVTESGVAVPVPKWELTREIAGRCLRAGEKRSFRVPLDGVRLPPGSYRIRVTYRPIQPTVLRGRCASAAAASSEWVPFEVRATL